jgi:hypothetical protein
MTPSLDTWFSTCPRLHERFDRRTLYPILPSASTVLCTVQHHHPWQRRFLSSLESVDFMAPIIFPLWSFKRNKAHTVQAVMLQSHAYEPFRADVLKLSAKVLCPSPVRVGETWYLD